MRDFLKKTERLAQSASLFFANAATIILLSLVALTVTDVVGRYFFTSPVTGAVELVETHMAGIIFFSFPTMFLRNDHIVVDLIPIERRRWFAWGLSIVLLLVTAYVAYRVGDRIFAYTVRAFEDNDMTEYLSIPRWPVVGFISGSIFVAAIMSILRSLVILANPGVLPNEQYEEGL